MNAYSVRASAVDGNTAKASCHGHLPNLLCQACGSDWGVGSAVWFPTVTITNERQRKLYSYERTISLKELNQLREGLVPRSKAKEMPPGAGFGPVRARLSQYATDFVWSGFGLLAAKPVVDKMGKNGIFLPYGPALVCIGNVLSEAYVALELPRKPICSKKTAQALGIERCQKCGEVLRLRGFDNELIDRIYHEYVADNLPKYHGLIIEDVDDLILAKNEFIQTYREGRMTGLDFAIAGVWI